MSGPSQADGAARFTCRTTYDDLTPERCERLKVSVLDALACAISALGASPIEACRAQAEEFGAGSRDCTLIGAGRANVIFAAFYNTALVRYVDYMDSYLVSSGLCHPSDNTARSSPRVSTPTCRGKTS
jgi:2-methylcitrate dehydratase